MKTSPVRWWRDDATRYQSRPPYYPPPSDHLPEWMVPPVLGPSILVEIARLRDLARAMFYPPLPPPSAMMQSIPSAAPPVRASDDG